MELLDLVNEQDEVIGVTTKEKSHQNRELHRIVGIYVFDSEGKLYIQEHLKSGGIYDHSVGGHVGQGESYLAAAKREAFEELGLMDEPEELLQFFPKDIITGRKPMHVVAMYEIHHSRDWRFVPNEEVKKIIPMDVAEVVSMMNVSPEKFTSDFIRTMKQYLAIKKMPLKIIH